MAVTSGTKNRILTSARDLIYNYGYHSVSIKEICEEADVKTGSFYYFFESKQDLALQVMERNWELMQSNILDKAFSKEIPALERFATLIELIYQYHLTDKTITGQSHGCPFGNMAVEMSTLDDRIREKMVSLFERHIEVFEQAIKDAIVNGDLPPLDTRDAAFSILAFLEGVLSLTKTWNNPELIKNLGKMALQIALYFKK